MARAARAVLYQLQRLDAYLLESLYTNVQRLHDRVHPSSAQHNGGSTNGQSHGHNYNSNGEVLSWTADGFRRMEIDNQDVVALQIAPWTFITSPYSYSLIIMAILLNRIQHVVVPTHDRPPVAQLGRIVSKFLPIDATSTQTRFLIRSISLYLLWKSLFRMGIIVLQAFGLFPDSGILAPVSLWASTASMVDVCWSSFVAVCVAMAVSTFTRGLDGSGPPTASFNLPQFAFLLHLYSSPLGSVFNPISETYTAQTPAPRPNRHVLFTLFLPLLQMTIIHTQGVWMRYSRHVLIPTAICGVLGLAHFIYTLVVHEIMEYPILQVVPSSLELFLLIMIICTTSLNASSQILLQGRITRPLFGPGANSLPGLDEEYAVALVRLGTSSVDASSVAGLGNQVAPLASGQEAVIRLGPGGVASLELPEKARKKKMKNPFALEIKQVRAVSSEGEMWINVNWMKEVAKFFSTLWKFAKGVWVMIRGRRELIEPSPTSPNEANHARAQSRSPTRAVYQRFLAGEVISDNEDSDFQLDEDEEDGSASESTSDTENVDDENYVPIYRGGSIEPSENVEEAGLLYSDHGRQRSTTPIAPVLLAHLTSSTGAPLTRRRYSSLLQPENEGSHASSSLRSRAASRTESWQQLEEDDLTRKMCVICMCSDRVIICWPCRCLSMCNDCRSNLASRNGPSKHSCPCCRQPVEGFSRIFIP